MSKVRILFMCVANSARSQMAEGLAKNIFGSDYLIESAGSIPKTVNPLAIAVMNELKISIDSHYSKSVDQINEDFINQLDYVITLCAEEVCPVLHSPRAQKIRWLFADPAAQTGSEHERLQAFRQVRDQIAAQLQNFKTHELLAAGK